MRLSNRLKRLEDSAPRCDGKVRRLVMEGQPITAADRCKICGGCHVLVIKTVIVETLEEARRWQSESQSRDET